MYDISLCPRTIKYFGSRPGVQEELLPRACKHLFPENLISTIVNR